MTQSPSVVGGFPSFRPGFRLIDGADLQAMAEMEFATAAGIVAHAGGGQAAAQPLGSILQSGRLLYAAIAEIATVASANDSVLLPLAIPGTQVVVINDGANSAQVFGQANNPQNGGNGDTIAAHGSSAQSATATGVAQAAATAAVYYCFALGKWKQLLTA